MNNTESPMAGVIVRQIVSIGDGREFLLYPAEGEPIRIVEGDPLWRQIQDAHKAATTVADLSKAGDKPKSFWDRMKEFVAKAWNRISQPIMFGARKDVALPASAPLVSHAPAAPSKTAGSEKLQSPALSSPGQDLAPQVAQSRGNYSPEKEGSAPQPADPATKKPTEAEKSVREGKILFNQIQWDKHLGFTATLGDGKRVEIGKDGPYADQFHAMMAGLAQKIRESHKEVTPAPEHEKGVETNKSQEVNQERRPVRWKVMDSPLAPVKRDFVNAVRDFVQEVDRDNPPEPGSEDRAEPTRTADPESAPAAKDDRIVEDAEKVMAQTANPGKDENAVFTPVEEGADKTSHLFIIRMIDQSGKERYFTPDINKESMPTFIERFKTMEGSMPLFGRVEIDDKNEASLVSMYSPESYGKTTPDASITKLTGEKAIKLIPMTEDSPAKGMSDIFEGIARIASKSVAAQIQRGSIAEHEAPSAAPRDEPTSAPAPTADSLDLDEANRLAQSASVEGGEPEHHEQIDSPSLAPVQNPSTAANPNEPGHEQDPFAPYKKSVGREK